MNSKLVLMLLVAIGSTALVASAQTPYRSDTPLPPGPPQTLSGLGADIPQPPAPPPPPSVTPPPGADYLIRYEPTRPVMTPLFGGSREESSLAHEANQLAHQLGEAKSDPDRDKLKTKLGEVLEKQFDQRQRRHEAEIKALEAQVKKLKDLVEKRQENRREIIARRLDQILRESQGLGW
jgi:hypothetical protein